jgi:hypothetical protein
LQADSVFDVQTEIQMNFKSVALIMHWFELCCVGLLQYPRLSSAVDPVLLLSLLQGVKVFYSEWMMK